MIFCHVNLKNGERSQIETQLLQGQEMQKAHKGTHYKAGKVFLYAQGKRRYDRKQSG